jgi:hypothetical protein
MINCPRKLNLIDKNITFYTQIDVREHSTYPPKMAIR